MKAELAALRALGLTEYGARAYLALVSLGSAPADDVASAAPVPRTKVYAVLADLARRGWVEVEAGRPRLYRARRPGECFARERARIDGLLDAALPLLEAHYQDRARRFAGPLWLMSGAEEIAGRALQMVQQAREDVLLVASFPLPGDEKALARALREAQRRGARVRVAAPDLDAPHARAFQRAGAEMRVLFLPPRVLLVDGRQALVAFPQPDGTISGVWNPSPELVRMMLGLAGAAWGAGEPALPP